MSQYWRSPSATSVSAAFAFTSYLAMRIRPSMTQLEKAERAEHASNEKLDRLFRRDLQNFAEARESMIHVFGMQDYADVMSNFAAGERYINRVWSASTDGYVDEVTAYLERARDQFVEAHRHFHELKDSKRTASTLRQSN